MTEHPITPPPELVQQWDNECVTADMPDQVYIATQAARWGADQELEACCEWLHWQNLATHKDLIPSLRAARRLKLPSLRERALEALGPEPPPENSPTGDSYLNGGAIERHRTIRRALEELPDAH